MNIRLIVTGKTSEDYLRAGIDVYAKRLQHYANFSIDEVCAQRGGGDAHDVKEREAAAILKHAEGADRVVLLDEHGSEHTSVGFANYLQKQMNSGIRTLAFVVGGAYGFAPEVYDAASDKLSLSQMTFNHQMVRLFFVEQLYRAFTILNHEPYHNE